jgi:hypothetical protein
MSNLTLVESVPREPLHFTVYPFDNKKTEFTLQARNMDQKQTWCQEIKKLMIENFHSVIPERAKQVVLGNNLEKNEHGRHRKDASLNAAIFRHRQHHADARINMPNIRRVRRKSIGSIPGRRDASPALKDMFHAIVSVTKSAENSASTRARKSFHRSTSQSDVIQANAGDLQPPPWISYASSGDDTQRMVATATNSDDRGRTSERRQLSRAERRSQSADSICIVTDPTIVSDMSCLCDDDSGMVSSHLEANDAAPAADPTVKETASSDIKNVLFLAERSRSLRDFLAEPDNKAYAASESDEQSDSSSVSSKSSGEFCLVVDDSGETSLSPRGDAHHCITALAAEAAARSSPVRRAESFRQAVGFDLIGARVRGRLAEFQNRNFIRTERHATSDMTTSCHSEGTTGDVDLDVIGNKMPDQFSVSGDANDVHLSDVAENSENLLEISLEVDKTVQSPNNDLTSIAGTETSYESSKIRSEVSDKSTDDSALSSTVTQDLTRSSYDSSDQSAPSSAEADRLNYHPFDVESSFSATANQVLPTFRLLTPSCSSSGTSPVSDEHLFYADDELLAASDEISIGDGVGDTTTVAPDVAKGSHRLLASTDEIWPVGRQTNYVYQLARAYSNRIKRIQAQAAVGSIQTNERSTSRQLLKQRPSSEKVGSSPPVTGLETTAAVVTVTNAPRLWDSTSSSSRDLDEAATESPSVEDSDQMRIRRFNAMMLSMDHYQDRVPASERPRSASLDSMTSVIQETMAAVGRRSVRETIRLFNTGLTTSSSSVASTHKASTSSRNCPECLEQGKGQGQGSSHVSVFVTEAISDASHSVCDVPSTGSLVQDRLRMLQQNKQRKS